MKLVYEYSNGLQLIHTKFISNKTMLKESKNAKQVAIYACDDLDIENRLDGFFSGKHVTTLLLN